jgi:hypothetical protein
MASIENFALNNKFLYGGMVNCFTWDLGRPYKRYRRLSTSQRSSMEISFVDELVCDINVKLNELRGLDVNETKRWGIIINIMDPLTQVRAHAYDYTKSSNHSVILIVQRGSWHLFESTGKYKMINGVVGKACAIATGTVQNPYFNGVLTQDCDDNTCVLWCAWAVFCVCVGYDQDSIMRVCNSNRSSRMHELTIFTNSMRKSVVDVLIVLHRLSVRSAQHAVNVVV